MQALAGEAMDVDGPGDQAVSQAAGGRAGARRNASVRATHSSPVSGRGCLVFRCREDAKPLL